MGFSGHASGHAVIGVTVVLTALATLAVSARLFARLAVVHNAGLDDGYIAAALLLSIVTTITMCLQVKWGMGRHMATLSLHEAVESQKPFYVSVLAYNIAMSMSKLSILQQYLRVFPQKPFRRSCFVMIGIMAVYTLWVFFSAIFACWPISYFWTKVANPEGGKCLNRFAVWFSYAGMNIVTDIITGILPLRVLRELELPKRQKRALMFVFALGGFTCIVSILRLQSLYVVSQADDITWVNPLAAIWSSVEVNTAILCSCLPTLRTYFVKLFPKLLNNISSHGEGTAEPERRPPAKPSSSLSSITQSNAAPTPQTPKAHTNRRPNISFDALGRGITGRGDPMQSSYAYSGHDNSSEEHELHPMPDSIEEDRAIQVTTTVEQDVESFRSDDDGRWNRWREGTVRTVL